MRTGEVARTWALHAARLLGAAETLRQAIGPPPSPSERGKIERLRAARHAALGDSAFAAAWAEGRAMNLELAVA